MGGEVLSPELDSQRVDLTVDKESLQERDYMLFLIQNAFNRALEMNGYQTQGILSFDQILEMSEDEDVLEMSDEYDLYFTDEQFRFAFEEALNLLQ